MFICLFTWRSSSWPSAGRCARARWLSSLSATRRTAMEAFCSASTSSCRWASSGTSPRSARSAAFAYQKEGDQSREGRENIPAGGNSHVRGEGHEARATGQLGEPASRGLPPESQKKDAEEGVSRCGRSEQHPTPPQRLPPADL
eukprot:380984-Pyramimonas_sp.AAC.2